MNRTTMTTEHLAHRFTSLLREALTDEQWAEMRGKNESGAYRLCCASHDYVDANMVMAAAFAEVHRREAKFLDAGDADIRVWNDAWALARQTALTATPQLTPRMRFVARHALGLPNKTGQSYRNHFVAGEGHCDWHDWMLMTAAGLATKHRPSALTGGDDLFTLTRAAADMALEGREKLDQEDFPLSA